MSKYKIIFRGEILPGQDPEQVQVKFAELFGVRISLVQPYFQGLRIFVKKDLDLLKAKAYAKAFKKTGVKIDIDPPLPKRLSRQGNFMICDFCGTEQKNAARCVHCGIEFSKYRTIEESTITVYNDEAPQPQSAPNPIGGGYLAVTESDGNRKKATIGVYLGLFLLVALSTVDYVAQKEFIDISRWFYVIPVLVFCYGLAYLAVAKGYSASLGVLGLTTLFGLAIIMFLPNQDSKLTGYLFKSHKLLGVMLLIVVSLWGYDQFDKSTTKSQFMAAAELLETSRSDYPTNIIETDAVAFKTLQREVQSFFIHGMGILLAMDPRPNDVELISGKLFKEVSRYVIWLQYQRFLHVKATKRIPYFLSEAAIRVEMDGIKRSFERIIPAIKNKKLSKSYTKWVRGFNTGQLSGLKEMRSNLQEIKFALDLYVKQYKQLPTSLASLVHEQPNMIHLVRTIEWNDRGTITLSANDIDSEEKTVVMAYYLHPTKDTLMYTRVGGTLPDKYMSNPYRVFSQTYQIGDQAILQQKNRRLSSLHQE